MGRGAIWFMLVAGCSGPNEEVRGTPPPSIEPTVATAPAPVGSAAALAPAPAGSHTCTVEVVVRGEPSYRAEVEQPRNAPYPDTPEKLKKNWEQLRAQAWKQACAALERGEHRPCEPIDCVHEKRESIMPDFESIFPYRIAIELRPGRSRARATAVSPASVEEACAEAEKMACSAGCPGGASRVAVNDAAVPYMCPSEHKTHELFRRSELY